MKKILIILMVLACFAGTAHAITYGKDNYDRHISAVRGGGRNDPLRNFINEVEGILEGTSSSTITNLLFALETGDPTSTEGRMYYNTNSNLFRFHNGSTWVNFAAGSGTVSLNVAYGNGSTIAVNDGAVTLTAPEGNDNIVLAIVQEDTGSTVAQTITSAGTGALLTFTSGGTGVDILGTGSTWTITKAGAATFVGITNTGDNTFTGSLYNVIWDADQDTFFWADDAVLGFGNLSTAPDVTITWNATNLLIESKAENAGEIEVGATNAIDLVLHANTTASEVMFNADTATAEFDGYDIQLKDADILAFGDDDDFTLTSDGTAVLKLASLATDESPLFHIGADQAGIDVKFWAATTGEYMEWDAGNEALEFVGAQIHLDDASIMQYGAGKDFTVYSDTANTLEFDPATAGNTIKFGTSDTDAIDIIWYSDVSGDTVTFNEENVRVEFEDVSLALGDGTKILFGDEIGTGDIEMYANGTELVIDGVIAETGTISIGLTDLGIDFKLWAATNAEGVLWDASDEALEFTGADITMDGPAKIIDAMDESGTKFDLGTMVTIIFNPTIGETLSYTVPTGYDLLILDAWGFKTAAAGVGSGDQWDLKNNNTNSIFAIAELAGVADKERVQFDDLVDTEYELEAGETLDLVAGEDTNDDGADGIITVIGMFKIAD